MSKAMRKEMNSLITRVQMSKSMLFSLCPCCSCDRTTLSLTALYKSNLSAIIIMLHLVVEPDDRNAVACHLVHVARIRVERNHLSIAQQQRQCRRRLGQSAKTTKTSLSEHKVLNCFACICTVVAAFTRDFNS